MYKTDNKLEPVELVHKLVSEAKHSKNESKGPYKDNKYHNLFSKKEMELRFYPEAPESADHQGVR